MNRKTCNAAQRAGGGTLWTAGVALAAFLFLLLAVPWPRIAVADPLAAGQSEGETITSNTVRTKALVILPAVNVPQVASVEITPSQPGTNDYWYWIVSRNSAGQVSAPAGSFAVHDVAAPSPSAPIVVSWEPVSGVASYDLLRTSTGTAPSGNCGCEVAGGTASTRIVDTLASTSAYSVSPGGVSVTLTNQQSGGAQSLLFQIGEAAAQTFAVLPINLTSGVTGTLPIANGGTGTASPGLVAGSGINISGAWPNQTVASTATSGVTEATLGQCGPNFYSTTAGVYGCKYYLTEAHTLVRIYAAIPTPSTSCTTNPVVGLYDVTAGAVVASVTIPVGATAVDSSTLSISMAANHVYSWDVVTVAAGCGTYANGFMSATYQ